MCYEHMSGTGRNIIDTHGNMASQHALISASTDLIDN